MPAASHVDPSLKAEDERQKLSRILSVRERASKFDKIRSALLQRSVPWVPPENQSPSDNTRSSRGHRTPVGHLVRAGRQWTAFALDSFLPFSHSRLRLPCHPPQARRWAPVATHPASRRGNELSGAHLAWSSTTNSEEIRHGILPLATSVGRYMWSRAPWLEGPGGIGPHCSTEPPPHSPALAPLPTQMGHQAAQCTVGTINWREMYGDDAFKIRPTVFQSDIDAVAKARKIDCAQLEEAARGWAQVRGV